MPITIGSNIASLAAQRNLNRASEGLSKTYERLSSGFRINHGADDPAGLALGAALSIESRLFSQSARNLNDGASLLNIADSALSELSNIVIRIKELAAQAASGTYSGKQRTALDAEAQALSREFSRIQQTTEFNGTGLLNGESSEIRLQVGSASTDNIVSGLGNYLGTGTLGSATVLATDTGITSGTTDALISEDINGDQILDLVTVGVANNAAVSEGQMTVRLGLGGGTFGSATSYAMDTGSTFGFSMAGVAGDLNGDGILDIVTAGYFHDGVTAYGEATVRLGLGGGTFGNKVTYLGTTGSVQGRDYAVALGDLNGDGILDLVTGGNSTGGSQQGQANVRLGLGNGTFGSATTYVSDFGGVSGSTRALNLRDLNGDGVLDLITAGVVTDTSTHGEAAVRLGRGDGTFGASTAYTTETGSVLGISLGLAVGDINGDGILDLVTSGYGRNANSQGLATVLIGRGDGTFGNKLSVSTITGSTSAVQRSVVLGDMNGDGILDLIATGYANNGSSQGQTAILFGCGDGTFGPKTTYSVETGSSFGKSIAAVASDLNNDGILDLITAGFANNGSTQGQASVLIGGSRNGVHPLLPFSLQTQRDARSALTAMTQKLDLLNAQRSKVGAFQSRIEIALSNVSSINENYKVAYSRIMDADVAEETANMVRFQVLQQATTAVLAQANQQPGIALALLKITPVS